MPLAGLEKSLDELYLRAAFVAFEHSVAGKTASELRLAVTWGTAGLQRQEIVVAVYDIVAVAAAGEGGAVVLGPAKAGQLVLCHANRSG